MQFLSAHRDTAVILLKMEVDELSLPVMEEIRLLVSLCSSVVHLVPKGELVSTPAAHRVTHCVKRWANLGK